MNLLDALETLRKPAEPGATMFSVNLVCGFTPLHLATFFSAFLSQRLPARRISTNTGLYGDLKGNLLRLRESQCDSLAVLIEWQDLDARLGIRNLGGWNAAELLDIVESASREMDRIASILKPLSRSVATVVSLPTVGLPPLFPAAPQICTRFELLLRKALADFASSLCEEPGVRILSTQHLDELSPLANRFDPKSEILFGFPYTIEHASVLAEQLANLIQPTAPKKGIITDLDDTLWGGLLGEAGTDGVAWDISRNAHLHGLYQQFLASLASSGTLLAVASKNDLGLVEQTLSRKDLLLSKENVFPLAVNWGPKSESVREILQVWNIAPESVVFIDDSPIEVAQVKSAFPEMECLIFPKNDPAAVWNLLRHLREEFGKESTTAEDNLRLQSIREGGHFREGLSAPGAILDEFLQTLNSSITFDLQKNGDRRPFELLNKTNQFNLNGYRYTDTEWSRHMHDPECILIGATYQDKFGSLGNIAVMLGAKNQSEFQLKSWVMSCRAFSRRIEYQCLKFLFERFAVEKIAFCYQETPRNTVMRDFLLGLLQENGCSGSYVSRNGFFDRCPPLYHQVSTHESD
jgi:FkbH-like protein